MGVYIKGMEPPSTCCHCPLIGYDPDIEWDDGGRETQGAYICVITHELIDNTKREDHCPLVYVQTHGRLIDADALLKDDSRKYDMYRGANGRDTTLDDTCHRAIQWTIEDAPTVIEEER